MENQHPFFEISNPVGEDWVYEFNNSKDIITLGRLEDNDISLSDPDQNISRRHCLIKFINNHWYIVDNGSANGTYVERIDLQMPIDVRDDESVILKKDDIILILSHFKEDQPIFWRLRFHDPGQTSPKKGFEALYHLEYHLRNGKLYKATRHETTKIKLTPQEHNLIDYIARCNQDKPRVCSYRELIEAVWGDRFGHHSSEINRLAWSIRQKIFTSLSSQSHGKTTIRK